MKFEELTIKWLANKKEIQLSDLGGIQKQFDSCGRTYNCYKCPCGGKDHYATCPIMYGGLSQQLGSILTCLTINQQWIIIFPNVVNIIKSEEESYLKLLQRADKICAKIFKSKGVSDETIKFLHETHGIDPEISKDYINDCLNT